MQRLIFISVMLIGFLGHSQKFSVKANVVKYEKFTTAERNLYVVPVGQIWKGYNTTTDRWEVNNGGAGWVADNTINSDDQALSLVANTLTLEDGGTVDLSGYLDNTDGQTVTDLSLSGTILSITLSGGNTQTVDLSSISGGGTPDGNDFVTAGTLTGENLALDIPNQTNPVINLSAFALDSDLTIPNITGLQDSLDVKANKDEIITGYVPYVGATDELNMNGQVIKNAQQISDIGYNTGSINFMYGTIRDEFNVNGPLSLGTDSGSGSIFLRGGTTINNKLYNDKLDGNKLKYFNDETDTTIVLSAADGTGTDDQTAAEVPYDNTTSGLTATDTQAAIDEVAASGTTPNTTYVTSAAETFELNSSNASIGNLYKEITLTSATDVTVTIDPTSLTDANYFAIRQDGIGDLKFDFTDKYGRYLKTDNAGDLVMIKLKSSDYLIDPNGLTEYTPASADPIDSMDGLLASWREEDLATAGTNGTTWTDRISSFDADPSGSVGIVSDGSGGKQIDFDGVDDVYIVTDDPAELDFDPTSDVFSFAFKLGSTHVNGSNYYVVKGGDGIYQWGYHRQNASLQYAYLGDDLYDTSPSGAPTTLGNIVVTYGASNVKVYKNGTLILTTARTSSLDSSGYTLTFGGNGSMTLGEFSLKDVLVFTKELNQTEVNNINTNL